MVQIKNINVHGKVLVFHSARVFTSNRCYLLMNYVQAFVFFISLPHHLFHSLCIFSLLSPSRPFLMLIWAWQVLPQHSSELLRSSIEYNQTHSSKNSLSTQPLSTNRNAQTPICTMMYRKLQKDVFKNVGWAGRARYGQNSRQRREFNSFKKCLYVQFFLSDSFMHNWPIIKTFPFVNSC